MTAGFPWIEVFLHHLPIALMALAALVLAFLWPRCRSRWCLIGSLSASLMAAVLGLASSFVVRIAPPEFFVYWGVITATVSLFELSLLLAFALMMRSELSTLRWELEDLRSRAAGWAERTQPAPGETTGGEESNVGQ